MWIQAAPCGSSGSFFSCLPSPAVRLLRSRRLGRGCCARPRALRSGAQKSCCIAIRRRPKRRRPRMGGFNLRLPSGQYRLTIVAEGKKAEYAQPIDVETAGTLTAITLSARGEITVAAAAQAQGATGGEAALEPGGERTAAEQARLQFPAAAGRGHHDGHQRRDEFHGAVCHQWAARRGGDVRDGRRGYQRSGNGRIDLLEFRCRRRGKHRLELGLDAGRGGPRRCGVYQYSYAFGCERFPWLGV